MAQVSTFVAIDCTSKFAFVRLVASTGKMEVAPFLRDLIEAAPYCIHTAPTDNGVSFTSRKPDIRNSRHIFDRVCAERRTAHRLTKVDHPRTASQIERMSRTIKDVTAKRFHCENHAQLRLHLVNSSPPTTMLID